MRLICLVGLLFVLSGCVPKTNYDLFTTSNTVRAKKATNKAYEYHIRLHDRIRIIIYKNPEDSDLLDSYATLMTSINKDGILVDGHGFVVLPLIGKVKLVGLTQHIASDVIAKKYSKFLNKPSVYVEAINKKAFILGEVHRKGILKLDGQTMDLTEAIATAGGFTDSAVRIKVLIISENRYGKKSIRSVDLTKFEVLNKADTTIRPNDIIYVPSDKWKKIKVNINDVLPLISTAEMATGYLQ